MSLNDSPHSLDPKPLPTAKPPTDESYADDVYASRYWQRNHQFMRFWELPNFVREALKEKSVDKQLGHVVLFEATVQRVTLVIRRRWAKRGQKKRRKTLLAKKQFAMFT